MLSSIRMYLNESDTRNQHYAKNGIVLFLCCRVLKFEIKGFGGYYEKNNIQEAYLPKISKLALRY